MLLFATILAAGIFIYMTDSYIDKIQNNHVEPNVMSFATRTVIALLNVITFTYVLMNETALQEQPLAFWCKSSMSLFSFVALLITVIAMMKVKNVARLDWSGYSMLIIIIASLVSWKNYDVSISNKILQLGNAIAVIPQLVKMITRKGNEPIKEWVLITLGYGIFLIAMIPTMKSTAEIWYPASALLANGSVALLAWYYHNKPVKEIK